MGQETNPTEFELVTIKIESHEKAGLFVRINC